MEINIINQSKEARWTRYRSDFMRIANTTETLLHIKQTYYASIIFVTPQRIREINREYRHIDRPTDVISFASRDGEDAILTNDEELGDIFINIEAIQQQAHAYHHTLRREVCFLFAHGLLHLLGYDHMNATDEQVMNALQDEILNEMVPKTIRS